jgi:hypothetical protein
MIMNKTNKIFIIKAYSKIEKSQSIKLFLFKSWN